MSTYIFSVAFSVKADYAHKDVSTKDLIETLEKHIETMKSKPEEIARENFKLAGCVPHDEEPHPNDDSYDEANTRYCDSCGNELSHKQYIKGEGLCPICVNCNQ